MVSELLIASRAPRGAQPSGNWKWRRRVWATLDGAAAAAPKPPTQPQSVGYPAGPAGQLAGLDVDGHRGQAVAIDEIGGRARRPAAIGETLDGGAADRKPPCRVHTARPARRPPARSASRDLAGVAGAIGFHGHVGHDQRCRWKP